MIYLNNKLVSESKAKVSVFDHGFLYGDGIYETLRVYNRVVFKIDEHIERLFRSASMISLKIPQSADEIKRAVYKTIRELVMSYFHEYTDNKGRKTLRSYSNPVNLSRFDKIGYLF